MTTPAEEMTNAFMDAIDWDKVDTVSMIMDYEAGELDAVQVLRLFGELIRTGLAWSLQGHYGRAARALIDQDILDKDGNLTEHAIEVLER